jgi:hypothetical protein
MGLKLSEGHSQISLRRKTDQKVTRNPHYTLIKFSEKIKKNALLFYPSNYSRKQTGL